jgi:hypothetical protein
MGTVGALAIKKLISGFNISLLIQASLSSIAHYFWTFESKNGKRKTQIKIAENFPHTPDSRKFERNRGQSQ